MKLFLAFAALAMVAELNIIGRLTGTEIILGGCAVVALTRCLRPSGDVLHFYFFAVLWFLAAIASDLYNGSAFDDLSRGWAKIGIMAMNFTALRWLIGNDLGRAIFLIYFLMIAKAARLAYGWDGDELGQDVFGGAWKMGYGQLVSATALLASAWLLRSAWSRPLAVALPFGAAAMALLMNARNLIGITALAGLMSVLTAGRRRPLAVPHLVAIGVTSVLAGMLVINIYHYTAREGLLGREAQDKYFSQAETDVGLVLGGRSESLASIPAIMDSPVLGHGSWARDIDYVLLYMAERERLGLKSSPIISDLIPSHSHLLGAWVEHGMFGAAFWVWALFVTGKGLLAAVRKPSPLTGFVAFIGISLLWDIPFSPFGLTGRVMEAAALYLMILMARRQLPVVIVPAAVRRQRPLLRPLHLRVE
ncbi:hypothetical protein ABB55_06340 [Prosthecomicrobium hirschii]|uniref:Uncharacterized protein n=1 Tax=Prosthecodimorpha hirschii TaxID=665126 RepID=A0A0P6VII0_9HYPH|nr:hypothetical protein [Prosthecomicrobium hirschii]KPL51893.1 hypothetical protein ABB55_06340 [Prosthecomicrobium hirschii]